MVYKKDVYYSVVGTIRGNTKESLNKKLKIFYKMLERMNKMHCEIHNERREEEEE